MLNYIWLAFLLIAVVVGGLNGKLPDLTKGAFDAARSAVMDIALPLIGIMAIWLGVMRLAERSGLVQIIAHVLRPLLRWLFPDVPAGHPAHGAMVMNMAANMLGLGNAATPLGLRAMALLEQLNPRPGVATNAMCTFLTLNTASIQLIPTTAIGLLAIAGSTDPTRIVPTAIIATFCAAVTGVMTAKFLEKLPFFRVPPAEPGPVLEASAAAVPLEKVEDVETITVRRLGPWSRLLLAAFLLLFVWFFVLLAFVSPPEDYAEKHAVMRGLNAFSVIAVPFLLTFFPLYAAVRGVKVYEQFVEGAKDAFGVATRIVPFLVAMLIAIRMLREAGVIDMMSRGLGPTLARIGFPVDLLPMVLMRPLSGSATQGIFVELINRLGPDTIVSRMAATIYGSTETTFYVLAVYFGSVAIRQTRHAVIAGLTADLVAVIAAIAICRLMFA